MTWNTVMGFISLIALFLPIFFILVLRLGAYKSFPALLFYYVLVFFYNLLSLGYFHVDSQLLKSWNILNNVLDIPLMLIFLTYFSTSASFTNKMKIGALIFILFEVLVIAISGYNTRSITIILGPGIIVVFSLCLHFFIRQTKITIMHRKAMGKAVITSSLLFAYGCYGIIYLMYYVYKTTYIADTFLVYFLVVTFSSLLMTFGLLIEKKRVKKLSELKQTRKELSMIYKEVGNVRSFKKVPLDFDKEQWN